jgi:hypothetical protein
MCITNSKSSKQFSSYTSAHTHDYFSLTRNKLAPIHPRFLYCLPIPIQHQTRNFVICKITWRRGAHQQQLIGEVVGSGSLEWWPLAVARAGCNRPADINTPQNSNGMSSAAMHSWSREATKRRRGRI